MKMNLLFRLIALCTALGLGGGFVWWQQKQASPLAEKTEEPTTDRDEEPAAPVLLPGSKSLVLVPPQKPGVYQLKQEESAKERVLLPSSKSAIPVIRPQRLAPPAKSDKP